MIPTIKRSLQTQAGRRAVVLSMLLALFLLFSVAFILTNRRESKQGLVARIYQSGVLLESIDLSLVTEPYSFTVFSADGGFNTISVRPKAIGMTDADCPDRLCVSMGYADSSLLPIVCLPHALVIEVTAVSDTAPDAVSY